MAKYELGKNFGSNVINELMVILTKVAIESPSNNETRDPLTSEERRANRLRLGHSEECNCRSCIPRKRWGQ